MKKSKIAFIPVTKTAGFVKAEELKQIDAFEKVIHSFSEQIESLTPHFLEKKLTAAHQNYSKNPTPENLAVLIEMSVAAGLA